MALKVMVYNVEYGGNKKTDAVMRSVGADVVGVLESYNRLPEIAKNAGYPYYDLGLQLLSKYPILEPSGANGRYALIEVRPGYAVAFFNAHMDYVKYGPKMIRRGMTVDEVLRSEREVRLSSMNTLVPAMTGLAADGWPVILTGDFNEPSSLDYTAATVGVQPGVTTAVAWPISTTLLGKGMTDAYREVHPDPVTDPGLTWGFNRKNPPDRIDYTYVAGPVEVTDSQLVGKDGDPGVDIGFPAWTSDHRAVVSDLQVTPQPLPTLVALDSRMLTKGDTLTVRYRLPDPGDGTVEVLPEKARLDATTYDAAGTAGTLTVETKGLAPGGYRVVLQDGSGTTLARNRFWVRPVDPRVVLRTHKQTYDVGEPIKVRWHDGPANRWDWIAVYRAGASNPDKDDYLVWAYTGLHDSGVLPPSVSGSAVLGRDTQGHPWPLPAGSYVLRYLLTDQYDSVGSTTFVVR
jgi:endonuclease/exonuclease/phosphatase family metal-dependent hydrolase